MLRAEDEETYCLRTQTHMPYNTGNNVICYRCGMLLGPGVSTRLGSLLDY